MNPKGVGLLIREGEGLTVEFKEKYSSRIDEDIVAFANAKGGAILLRRRMARTKLIISLHEKRCVLIVSR